MHVPRRPIPPLAVISLGLFIVLVPACFSQTASTAHTCHSDTSDPTDGERALAREDYDAALAFYSAGLKSDPSSLEANLGYVRALIGKDRTDDAIHQAADMLAKSPHSSLAEVAAGEAAFRAADFDATKAHIKAALADDPCDARARELLARYSSIIAYFASEARNLDAAHKLRPNDEVIRRHWIESLPRKQQQAELASFLAEKPDLSTEDHAELTDREQRLKADRSGDCRITSKSQTAKIAFKPLFGDDGSKPTSFGLDVALNSKHRHLQIDTGSSGITLTPDGARKLGLTPELQLQGGGGVGDKGFAGSYLAHVDKIQIGDVEFSDCLVDVLNKTELTGDGYVGIDVFSSWLVTLDYQNMQLLLNPLPQRPSATNQKDDADTDDVPQNAYVAPQMADWLHIIRIGHQLLLPATLNNGPVHYVIADTGSGQTFLSLPFARQAGKIHSDTGIEIQGFSGKVDKIYRLDYAALQFEHLQLPVTSYYAFDTTNFSHSAGVEVSGFIGLPTLQRLTITIDYRDNLMQLKYDPNHDVQRF